MTIIDMHVHLKYRSRCSNLAAEDIDSNISPRIDGVCLTDHWLLKERLENPFKNLQVFYGVEIDCLLGDILGYGMTMLPFRKRNLTADYIIKVIHSQGGVAVCAHPFSNRHEGFGKYIFDYEFDAIEINGSLDPEYWKPAKKAAEEMDIPTIGGSDAHSVRQMNSVATKFHIPINSVADIVKAIKNKECEVVKL